MIDLALLLLWQPHPLSPAVVWRRNCRTDLRAVISQLGALSDDGGYCLLLKPLKLQLYNEVHTVELTKYNLEEGTISQASKLEQWAFLLLRAQDYDAVTLRRLLPGIEFETAIETIEMISEKTEDKQMYDQREKA